MEDGDKQKARERERQREEEGEERESVVNGEQRGVSEWFQKKKKQEKTGKERREGRKRGETKQAPKTYSNCSHCGPERPAAVLMSTIRILFGCLLFRTAAGLSGPQWLQLEYVLGACFSGPLHVFRTVMSTIRVRFGCLLFRTAALEYFLGACFSGPLQVFPDHNGYN